MTKSGKRGQCLHDGVPHLTVKSNSGQPRAPGHPVPKGSRGTVYRDRNPMHDTEPPGQDEGHGEPIRTQLKLKGVV
jgi:hypothetical protein